MNLIPEINTIALFVILVELAFLLYHIWRMSKQDKCMQDLIKRLDEHSAKLDRYAKQTVESMTELDVKIDALLGKV